MGWLEKKREGQPRRVNLFDYGMLSMDERVRVIDVIERGVVLGKKRIWGIQYLEMQDSNTGEIILIDKKIENAISKDAMGSWKKLKEQVQTGRVNLSVIDNEFGIRATSRFIEKEEIEEVLNYLKSNSNGEDFEQFIGRLYLSDVEGVFKLRGKIDFDKYLSLETLYGGLTESLMALKVLLENGGRTRKEYDDEKSRIIRRREELRRKWLDEIEEKGKSLKSYVQSNKNAPPIILIDTLLQKILNSTDEEEKKRFIKMLAKINFEGSFIGLINWELLSPEDIRKVYQIDELRRKIDTGIRLVEPEIQKKVLGVIRGDENEAKEEKEEEITQPEEKKGKVQKQKKI